ncbi:DNA topoisomerase IB [Solicola sp. PLA-1-18]|uniref:DNA topoisomerase IB n=1 Tax=Solicola sp. PLA-1-18 TaxID=3380532 RepID=UPI003B7BE4FF
MVRLRTVSPSDVGWTRVARGKGFSYLDETGERLPPEHVARCKALVIPPAWQEVWICRYDNGHIQATGMDDAGRKQYRYHDQWRVQRDMEKHERVLTVARNLPDARKIVREDLDRPGMPRERALATAFRLLDMGFFRVGNEQYVTDNGSYGLSTLRKDHCVVTAESMKFCFVAKSGKRQEIELVDDDARDALRTMRRRRGGGEELLAYRDGRKWRDIASDDINEYVRDVIGAEMTAKDFRTWHATVLAAVALAVSTSVAHSRTGKKRAISRAMQEVSGYLGNTPTVARASYVDPRVIDLYEGGRTIEHVLPDLGDGNAVGEPATHGVVERAVLDLLS